MSVNEQEFQEQIDKAWGIRRKTGKVKVDSWSFPKAPCTHLCRRKDIRRFHFGCLTCPIRKFHLNKDDGKLVKYQRALMVLESASGRGFIMPKEYRVYGLIYSRSIGYWRRWILKALMTVAERIAEVK